MLEAGGPRRPTRAEVAGRIVRDSIILGASVVVGLIACVVATWSGPFGATVGGADLYAMFLSKHAYIADRYLDFRFPLWNPYEFAGLPLHGTSQGSALYLPVVLPNLFLGRVAALQVAFWFHIVGFCVVTTLYLRDRGLHPAAACIASFLGIVWFFESANAAAASQAHYTFEFLYVPAILFAWSRFTEGSRAAAVALPLLVCFQWLPGYPEFPMDTAVLLGLVALTGPGPPLWNRVAWVVGLVALGTLLAGIQLLPLAESTSESLRIQWAEEGFSAILSGFSVAPGRLHGRLVGPMGAAGAVLFLAGLLTPASMRRPWLVAFGFAFFAVTWPLVAMYEIYPYKLFRFAWGWVHLAPFFAACLAGLAIDRIVRGGNTSLVAAGAGLVVAVLAGTKGNGFGAMIALACAVGLALGTRVRGFGLAVVALAVVQAAVGFSDLTVRRPQAAPDLVESEARAVRLHELRQLLPGQPRVFGEAEMRAGSFLAEHLPAPIGHEAAVPPRRVTKLVRHIGMWNAFGPKERRPALWQGLARNPEIAAALGLGIVTGSREDLRPLLAAGYRLVASFGDDSVAVFRVPVPRVAIHHDVIVVPDEAASFEQVTGPGFDPFRRVVIETTGEVDAVPVPAGAEEDARVVIDEPERVVVQVILQTPGVLVLRDAQYPGWSVAVDGVEAPSLTANGAFRAVALAEGIHEVTWRYRPLSVLAGALASAVGLGVLGGLGAWLRRPGTQPWPGFDRIGKGRAA